MPMSYMLDHARRLVRIRGWGAVTEDDVRELFSRIVSDPAFRGDYGSLNDMSEATEVVVDSAGLVASAAAPVFTPGVKRAVVAPADVVFGAARAYASFGERLGQTVRVFRTLEAAERWLAEPT